MDTGEPGPSSTRKRIKQKPLIHFAENDDSYDHDDDGILLDIGTTNCDQIENVAVSDDENIDEALGVEVSSYEMFFDIINNLIPMYFQHDMILNIQELPLFDNPQRPIVKSKYEVMT